MIPLSPHPRVCTLLNLNRTVTRPRTGMGGSISFAHENRSCGWRRVCKLVKEVKSSPSTGTKHESSEGRSRELVSKFIPLIRAGLGLAVLATVQRSTHLRRRAVRLSHPPFAPRASLQVSMSPNVLLAECRLAVCRDRLSCRVRVAFCCPDECNEHSCRRLPHPTSKNSN